MSILRTTRPLRLALAFSSLAALCAAGPAQAGREDTRRPTQPPTRVARAGEVRFARDADHAEQATTATDVRQAETADHALEATSAGEADQADSAALAAEAGHAGAAETALVADSVSPELCGPGSLLQKRGDAWECVQPLQSLRTDGPVETAPAIYRVTARDSISGHGDVQVSCQPSDVVVMGACLAPGSSLPVAAGTVMGRPQFGWVVDDGHSLLCSFSVSGPSTRVVALAFCADTAP